ncbi:histidine kinase [Carboxylicivirga sediminis]|uniref:Histidine kinase n=1 Tax=Carboxylicivirga sediminis TaxID=2006564 RepID=A0A941F6I3_9BACT|nr:histidine kinase [Carboxylicivirga sediminis]MBR8537369.1 histidine kinase [Carboxylicivirga sediminis]
MSIYSDICNKKYSVKKTFYIFLSYGITSALIGVIFLGFACPKCLLNMRAVGQNAGYSLLLGYSLFSFGFIFGWLENKYVAWISAPIKSLIIVLVSSTIYSSLVIFSVNWLWHSLLGQIPFKEFYARYAYIMWIEFGIFYFIALWFYARSFFIHWRKEVENREKLKRQALQLQYESLKTQVNPHFLFNSLNALTTLIEMNVPAAKQFTHELSCFYRDILQLKNKEIIPLEEEIQIVKRYIYLQKIRFGDNFTYHIPDIKSNNQMVIPLSLQMLAENVFKHNSISANKKVHLDIQLSDDEVIISNTFYPRKDSSNSGTGLKNLNERILYLTNKQLTIKQDQQYFTIHLPLIQLDNAHINS